MNRTHITIFGLVLCFWSALAVADKHGTPFGTVAAPPGVVVGTLTVQLEFEDTPRSGCPRVGHQPEVRLDRNVVSWRAPNLGGFTWDTANPYTTGIALQINRVPAGTHEVRVGVPANACRGYGWVPSNSRRISLNSGNRYAANVRFSYKRLLAVPEPKLPIKPTLKLPR